MSEERKAKRMKRSEIIIKNMQIKSAYKLRSLAAYLNDIEVECGIKEVKITLDNVFVCPDIDLKKCKDTPMEKLLVKIIKKI